MEGSKPHREISEDAHIVGTWWEKTKTKAGIGGGGGASSQVGKAGFIVWVDRARERARVWETSGCPGDRVGMCLL